ncbi:MAG TPA: SEL1-like repeat protein [Polyangiaceae bacterium]|nr:SEL1-like repeat protein [Polyangiaceae bacterium]
MRGRRVRVMAFMGLLVVAGSAEAQVSSGGVTPSAAKTPATLASGTFDRLPSRPEARFALAQRYEAGNGTLKDAYLAAHWARLAAETGSVPAAEWLKAEAEGGPRQSETWRNSTPRSRVRKMQRPLSCLGSHCAASCATDCAAQSSTAALLRPA